MKPLLEVENISYRYSAQKEAKDILNKISFSVLPGEFVSLVGPSGAGKTTLFNLLAGLLPLQDGSISLEGEPLSKQRKRIGYMLQKDLLFPWRTILENTLIGVEIHKTNRKSAIHQAIEYLQRYGLADYANAYPNQLSGGMRQRVALIRTLMVQPHIILLDEPFSAVDYQTRLLLEKELLDICANEHRTMMLITHDIGEAISLGDSVIVLGKSPATVKAKHRIELSFEGSKTPWGARKAPEYQKYFDQIWDELEISTTGMVSA